MKPLSRMSTEELLEQRLCDLRLRPTGFLIGPALRTLYAELRAKGLRFRPRVWLSTEWFSPVGIAGFAVPFYLAHPRLLQLELDCLGEAEGWDGEERRQLMRHEAGHAFESAYRTRRLGKRRMLFGLSSQRYPSFYCPSPNSRRHVQHLADGYAQSHPDEDFAETFAVWLTPRSRWRKTYARWPTALSKLHYIDRLVVDLVGRPVNVDFDTPGDIDESTQTLRAYYARRQRRALNSPAERMDRTLNQLFVTQSPHRNASRFLIDRKRSLSEIIAKTLGKTDEIADRVVARWAMRCRELDLRLRQPAEKTMIEMRKHLSSPIGRQLVDCTTTVSL